MGADVKMQHEKLKKTTLILSRAANKDKPLAATQKKSNGRLPLSLC
jgi:hypothetical protein